MESIKDKVAIIGVGCTRYGELWGMDYEDMVVECCYEAMQDAGIEAKDIQAAWYGTYSQGQGGLPLAHALKLDHLPITRVENACATGGDTVRNAAAFVAAGLYDIVLAVGADKRKDGDGGGNAALFQGAESLVRFPPFALAAMRYAHHYGLTYEQLKETLGRIAIKNHHNGMLNPKAAIRREITMEDYMKAPMINYPLGLYDCCADVDGASACIITRPEIAKHFRDDYVVLKGLGLAIGAKQPRLQSTHDMVHAQETVVAAQEAYRMAGIKDPLKELDMAELHDAFTVVELVCYEDLGLAPRGGGPAMVRDGVFEREGQLPVNIDGGLKAFGHPGGPTGIKMMYEICKQMQGKAGPRQLKDVSLAMSHNQGGWAGQYATFVGVYGTRD
jgi:acetyl-CoA C-acetyltransferase